MAPERDGFREKLVRPDLPLFINVVIRGNSFIREGWPVRHSMATIWVTQAITL
jgi:hypothetical protein